MTSWRKLTRAGLKDLVTFLEKQVRISSEPLFGNIQDNQGGRKPSNAKSRVPTKGRNESRKSFATTVSHVAIQTPYTGNTEDTKIEIEFRQ